MFRNKYQLREVEPQFSEPGSPIKLVRAGQLDKDNNLKVVVKGEENLYAYINSFAESVDINVIMNRFLNGDKEILLQRAGAYLDISELPNSFQELVDININAQNVYNTLPIEIKEKFHNNINQFISTMGSDEWIEIMNTSQHEIMREKDKEVRANTKILQEQINPSPSVPENPPIDVPTDPQEPVIKGVKK